jgi:hypothetical protein
MRILPATLVTLFALSGCGEVAAPASEPDRVAAPPANPTSPAYAALPEGPPTGVPWWQDGVLHVDGTTIRTRLSMIVHRGGTTVVGRTRIGRGAEWHLVREGDLVPLVTGAAPINPLVGADGRRVAWAEVDDELQRITAYDVASGRVAGTWTTDEPVSPYERVGAVTVRGTRADGRVLLTALWDRARWWGAWTPGEEPETVREETAALEPWPGGPVWPRTVPPIEGGTWSDDGRRYAYQSGGWSVAGVDGEEVGLRTPADVLAGLIAWESPTSVLLEAHGSQRRLGLLRCDATTGACERVRGGPGSAAMLPDPYLP